MKRSPSSALVGGPVPRREAIHDHQTGAEHGNLPSAMTGGIWLLWAGVGASATLSSMGYSWLVCNASNSIFFLLWARTNINIRVFFKALFHFLTEIFFKDFNVAGVARVPDIGPVILACAPHANQFVDGLVIMRSVSKRDVGFLVAAKSLTKPFIGDLINSAADPIGVVRPQDVATTTSGLITALESVGFYFSFII
jgi:1-acyl-sn-glycerol-3-phosphate acyltransferase